MKLVRFDAANGPRSGIVDGDGIVDVHDAVPELAGLAAPGDMAALIGGGDAVLDAMKGADLGQHRLSAASIRLLAPIVNPPKIVCCWVNYVEDGAAPPSDVPIFFGKFNTSIIGNGEAIRLPKSTRDVAVEPELSAIIGRPGKDIGIDDALSHVFGYTITNDVTSFNHRLVDLIGSRGPNMMAKIFDTFAPMGPCIVTRDEIPNPHGLRVRQWLNDDLQIDANTGRMVTRLPEFISYVSSFCSLQAGDVLLTGSPKPLGKLKFVSPGDEVRMEIEGIGILSNPVVAA